jgi:hypothetical protein
MSEYKESLYNNETEKEKTFIHIICTKC